MNGSAWKMPGYLVDEPLGAGGSGEVWRGQTKSDGTPVALKRITVRDPAALAAARSEAAILATLEHPHLIGLREVVSLDGAIVLVLDLAAGGSLAGLLAARGRLTPGETITAIAPIGAALAYAHGTGVVHGDVTPANIVFSAGGVALLTDLGVARLLGDVEPVLSTPAYLDPAVASGQAPDPSSDVFMLGAVALHALTGAPAWGGDSPRETLTLAQAGDLRQVGSRLAMASVPEAMAEVIARALAREPAQRGTAADFALDLRHTGLPTAVELAAGRQVLQPGSTRPGTGVQSALSPRSAPTRHVAPPPRPLPARRSRRRLRERPGSLGVLIAAACALAAGAIVLTWPGDDAATPDPDRTVALGAQAAETQAVQTQPVQLPAGSSTLPSGPPSSPPPAAGATLDAASAGQVLVGLDQTRARAFAQRQPDLLANVYVAGPLLSQDAALLKKIVPAGCGLVGVHTAYALPRVMSRSVDTVTVQVRTTLSRSTLECDGTPAGSAPGAAARTLRVTLIRSGTRYLIGGITA